MRVIIISSRFKENFPFRLTMTYSTDREKMIVSYLFTASLFLKIVHFRTRVQMEDHTPYV